MTNGIGGVHPHGKQQEAMKEQRPSDGKEETQKETKQPPKLGEGKLVPEKDR